MSPMLSPQDRFPALDLCELTWTASVEGAQPYEQKDIAILLEISKRGGLFQTNVRVAVNTNVHIRIGDAIAHGCVLSSTGDEYGFLVEVHVSHPSDWFPNRYQPAYLMVPKPLAA